MVENIGNIEKVQPAVQNTPETGDMHRAVEGGLPIKATEVQPQNSEVFVSKVGGYDSPEVKEKVLKGVHAGEEIGGQSTDPKKSSSWRETFDKKVQGGDISNK